MPTNEAVIVAEDIHKSFGTLEVLRGVSLAARNGDVISIIGSSGSGKSTFLRCINLLDTPDRGRILFAGEEIRVKSDTQGRPIHADRKQTEMLRRRLGMVFQSFNLWSHMTVLQNVMEGPVYVLKRKRAEVKDEAMALLEKVGIAEKHDRYPSELSGGQQQRAAIARALCMTPVALLFDEPTSSLDPELVGEVLSVMRNLAEDGRTMIIATHEMGFAREVSSEVVFLHGGLIEERAPPSEFFSHPKSERCRQFLFKTL